MNGERRNVRVQWTRRMRGKLELAFPHVYFVIPSEVEESLYILFILATRLKKSRQLYSRNFGLVLLRRAGYNRRHAPDLTGTGASLKPD